MEAYAMTHRSGWVTELMAEPNLVARFSSFFHAYLLLWLLAAYALAAVAPAFGLLIRHTSWGELTVFQETLSLSLPFTMLAVLLFNAGLGVQATRLKSLMKRTLPLLVGLVANFLIPIAFIAITSQIMKLWHNPVEVQDLILGLALVAAMPIAGSSTAWSQVVNGDLALSLGLVLSTTLLSPVTTPAVLYTVSLLATGQYAEALKGLATGGTGAFLWVGVVFPSLLGILVRLMLGEARITSVRPHIKFLTAILLLLLNYSNASLSLPQVLNEPDLDFLLVTLTLAFTLCLTTFVVAFWLGRLLEVDAAQEASLMYGLGMNNNGTGLVLASLSLAAYPQVMLPIIFYNLVQHVVAGIVQFLKYRTMKEA
jgi:bile acid:Na+ symporter, BASS family